MPTLKQIQEAIDLCIKTNPGRLHDEIDLLMLCAHNDEIIRIGFKGDKDVYVIERKKAGDNGA